jgi:uncharacterized protein YgiM (DUF1202 family)
MAQVMRVLMFMGLFVVLSFSVLSVSSTTSVSASGWNAPIAHRDGCHRWHTCPSDTGSYRCGDLGHPCQGSSTGSPGNTGNNSPSSRSTSPTVSYVNTDALNLRANPSLQSRLLDTYGKGKIVSVLERTADGKWAKVEVSNPKQSGWMLTQYLSSSYPGGPSSTALASSITDGLRLRIGPGTQYSIIGLYPNGTLFRVLGTSSNGEWVKVQVVLDDRVGWVMARYVKIR